MGRGGAIYVPADNRLSMLGYALGQMQQQQQQKKEEQDAIKAISQALNPSVNSTDTTNAQNQIMQQMGLGGLSGQDARQVLADRQQQWQSLEDSKANLTKQEDIDAVNQQQQTLHAQADRVRQLLGASLGSGFGAGDDAASSYSNMQSGSKIPVSTQVSPYVSGNIDIYNRPQVKLPDGSTATVRSMNFDIDGGRSVLVPTISQDGKEWTPQQAIENYRQTGQHLGIFNSSADAEQYAQDLHKQQEQQYLGPQKSSYQPATISFDAINQNGQYSPDMQKLASGIAQLRAQSSPDIMKALIEKGYSPQTMQKAQQYLSIADAQQKAKQNAPMIAQIAAALQKSGNSVGGSVAQWALQNGINPKDFMEYMKNINPEYKAQDLGGQTLLYPQNGTGYGPAQSMQNSLSPGEAFKGQVSMRNNDGTNAARVQSAQIGADATVRAAGIGANSRVQVAGMRESAEARQAQISANRIVTANQSARAQGLPAPYSDEQENDAKTYLSNAVKPSQGKQEAPGGAPTMAPVIAQFQKDLEYEINTNGADAAREKLKKNRTALEARGINVDEALKSWIPS